MSALVYNRDTLKQAVVMLLDRKYGKNRTERVRMFIKGVYNARTWFNGKRACLFEIAKMANQPGGAIKALDLLDLVDKRREAIMQEEHTQAASVFAAAERNALCARRYYAKVTMALLTEAMRRARVGEPQLTDEEKKSFIVGKQVAWRRRTAELIAEQKRIPGQHLSHPQIARKVAEMVRDEEIQKYEKEYAGRNSLSDSARRALNAHTQDSMWERAEALRAAKIK